MTRLAAAPGARPRPARSRASSCGSAAARSPYPLQLLAYGAAVVAAAFLLAWACEAAQVDIARGVVVAAVAFVAILPEYIVEVHFAFTGRADVRDREPDRREPAAARRVRRAAGGGGAAAAALAPARRSGRSRWRPRSASSSRSSRLAALWSLRGVVRGPADLLDALVLIALYGLYLRRAAAATARRRSRWASPPRSPRSPRAERRRWVRGADGVRRRRDPADRGAVRRRRARHRRARRHQPVPAAAVDRARSRPRRPELVVAFVLLTHGRGGAERRGAARRRREPVHARARHAAARLPRRRRNGAAAAAPGASGSSCCSRSASRSTRSPRSSRCA